MYYLNDYREGQKLVGTYLCKSKQILKTKAGKTYYSLILQDKTGTMVNTDWQDAIFRTAYSTKHSLSISGRTKSINYFVGANYLYREGTIIGSDFERYGLRVNLDGKRNRLKYGVSFSPSYSKSNYVDADAQYGGDGVIASALMAPPVFPVYNSDGSYNWDMNGFLRINTWDTQTNEVLNPVALALEIDDIREKLNILGNVFASYEFIKGLELSLIHISEPTRH